MIGYIQIKRYKIEWRNLFFIDPIKVPYVGEELSFTFYFYFLVVAKRQAWGTAL